MKGYDVLFGLDEARGIRDYVPFLQGLPEERTVGGVVGEVHRGKVSGCLLGEDGQV